METYIHKYLSSNYVISSTEESSKKIQLIVRYGIYHRNDESLFKTLAYPKELLGELVTIFGIKEYKARLFVNSWVKKTNNVNLRWYWRQRKNNLFFPVAIRIAAQTMGLDLVSVQPMKAPKGKLFFNVPQFSGTTEHNINDRIYDREVMLTQLAEAQNILGELDHPNEINLFIDHSIGVSSRKKKN